MTWQANGFYQADIWCYNMIEQQADCFIDSAFLALFCTNNLHMSYMWTHNDCATAMLFSLCNDFNLLALLREWRENLSILFCLMFGSHCTIFFIAVISR